MRMKYVYVRRCLAWPFEYLGLVFYALTAACVWATLVLRGDKDL